MCIKSISQSSASAVWIDLKEKFDKIDGFRIFQLHKQIATMTQGTNSTVAYFSKLRLLWDEFDALVPSPCDCPRSRDYVKFMKRQKLLQIFMGLNESYEQARSQILMMIPLPTVNKTYSMLIERESRRSMTNTLGTLDNVEMNALMTIKGGRCSKLKRTLMFNVTFVG